MPAAHTDKSHARRYGAGLRGWQTQFASALHDPDAAVPAFIARPTSVPASKRFDVYRNNVYASLTEALRARCPVVARIVGPDFFSSLARVFVAHRPPRSPALFEYGADFGDFVEDFEHTQALPYLADVARLEWLRALAYHAADAEPLGPAALGRIPPDRIEEVRLRLHPAAGLIWSPYPIVSIWETNTHDTHVRRIGPEAGDEAALVMRPSLDVLVTRLDLGSHALGQALAAGATFGQAAEVAVAADPQVAIADSFSRLLTAGAFSDFTLAAARS